MSESNVCATTVSTTTDGEVKANSPASLLLPTPTAGGVRAGRTLVRNSRSREWEGLILKSTGLVLALALAALICFIWWHTSTTFALITINSSDTGFTWGIVGLMNLTLIRLLALLCGTAVMFAGVATAFYTIDNEIRMSGEGATSSTQSFKGALATASPGVVAVLAGAVVIAFSVASRVDASFTPSGKKVVDARERKDVATKPTPWADQTAIAKKYGIVGEAADSEGGNTRQSTGNKP